MRWIRIAAFLFLVVIGTYYFIEYNGFSANKSMEETGGFLEQKKNGLSTKKTPPKKAFVPYAGDIFQWINQSANELSAKFGKPLRKDPSGYGYQWWVYTDKQKQYIQFGIDENKVKSIFAVGDDLSLEPIQIGQDYNVLSKKFSFANEVAYNSGLSSYTFRLTDEELTTRPLVKVNDDAFMQLYFDTFTDKLSSIRVLTPDLLLLHRPYEIKYRGKMPNKPILSDEQWQQVDNGMQQQIFHMTNIIRNYYKRPLVKWDETVSNVAYTHSKDMAKNNYFSHYGQNGDGLKERLAAEKVFYQAAGENIAAQYSDAPAAVNGWLNSKGHREALLNKNYTHLGVGVYRFYYTQNFLTKQ